jgi:fructosamine-3-kinase
VDLGRQLAALHAVTRAQYGLSRCNFVGAIPQGNMPAGDWMEFFIKRRLGPQLRLAQGRGYGQPEARILATAESLLHDHNPTPSLLHGNLLYWNVGPTAGGKTVLLDPAPYYGDPEIDLGRVGWHHLPSGMDVVNRGLDHDSPRREDFLDAYGELPAGYYRRLRLYEVYNALVRLNFYRGKYPAYPARHLENSVRELLEAAEVPPD